MKLYSMVLKAKDSSEEEQRKAQARAAQNAKQAALRRVEASRLGKVLSEMTTRRVLLGMLLMLLVAESGRWLSRAQLRALKSGHLGACSVRRNWYRSLNAA